MAFTKIVGAGIHTLSNVHSHNINSSGIITATSFVGPFNGSDGDFSGNVTIDGNLIVNGDTTTLNTTLREVEILRVDANTTATAGIITQRGSGDILNLFDGAGNELVTVLSNGNVGIGSAIPELDLDVARASSGDNVVKVQNRASALSLIKYPNVNNADVRAGSDYGNFAVYTGGDSGSRKLKVEHGGDVKVENGFFAVTDPSEKIGIGLATPTKPLHIYTAGIDSEIRLQTNSGTEQNSYISLRHSTGHLDFYTVQSGTNMKFHITNNERLKLEDSGLTVTGNINVATGDIAFLNNGHKIHNSSSSGNVTIQGGASYAGGKIYLSGGYGSGGGTGDIRFYADGTTTPVERLRIGSNGSVGIGTDHLSGNNSVYHKLMVEGDTTSQIGVVKIVRKHSSASNNSYTLEVDSSSHTSNVTNAGAMSVNVNSGRAFTIDGNGKVGIGTDTPNGDLQIRTGANASFRVLADTSTSGLFVGNYGSGDGYRSLSLLGSNIRLYTITAGALSGAVQRVHITPTGQVGVGTDTVRNNRTMQITGESGTTLLLTGFAPGIHFNGQTSTDSSDNDRSAIGQASGSNHFLNGSSSGDTVLRGTSSGKLLFGIGTAVKMQLNSAGKLGIGVAPSTGVDIGYDVHIKKGSSEPNGKLIIQSHDTANSNAQIQLLARDNSNNNETCVIKAMNASVSSQIDLWLYTNDNTNQSIKLTGNDGAAYFQGVNSSGLQYQFYNAASGGSSDTRVLIKTYPNQGADPYIKFDSGGSNHVVGQLYAGTTNNKLVLGVGESPSGGVSGIHIAGDGVTQVTNHLYMTKSSDPRIYAGSSVGLNIDGQALYLNRYVNSTIAMGRGGGAVEVSNTNSGNDSQLNIYKSSGGDTDDAVLRVGYDSANCLSIVRQRNSSQIKIDYNQNDTILRFQANGDDAMILTNRQMVNIAKLTPLAIVHREIVSNSSWSGGRPVKFYMRFSTGNFSGSYHVARMISQNDWGFADWQVRVLRDYYSPDTHDGALTRYTGYYNSHSETIVTYNMRSNSPDIYGDGRRLSKNTNLGPSGNHKIHTAANGGYYKDAYATDYYINLGTYSGVLLEVTVNNPGGYLKDTSTTLTDTYPAAFGSSVADQATADAWNGASNGGGGRGIWFNVRQGVIDSSWTGAGSSGNAYNYGDSNLPIS